MKRVLFITLALLAIVGRAAAQNTISCAEVTVRSGQQAVLPIELTNEEGLAVVAIQFTLTLPEGVTVATDAEDPICSLENERLKTNAFTIYPAKYSDSSWGFGITATGTATLQGTEGAFMTITLNVADDMVEGEHEVSLTENKLSIRGDNNDVTTMPIDNSTSKLTVSNVMVLDENSTTVPESATGVSVCVKRTINANVWSTICLPFEMTGEQVKTAFGEDVQLGDFKGYETTEDNDENIVSIKVFFEGVNAIEANHPYIIKVSTPIEEFSIGNVDIDPEEEPTVAAVKRTKKQWSEMKGTYVANTVLEETTLFLNDNKFWYSNGLTKMKAFRAYFDFYDVLTEVEEAGVKIFVAIDGEETGIEGIPADAEGSIYDLGGRKVAKPSQHGVYIVNGKKVLK